MSVVYGILLQAKGDIKKIKLKDAKNKDPLSQEDLQKILKKKTHISFIGDYTYESITISLFGYTSGKAGTENKHELPPPHNTVQLYSDSLIIASKDTSWTNPINFTAEQYEKFYQHAFENGDTNENFDEDSYDENEEEDEDTSDEDNLEEEKEDEIISAKKKKAVEDGEPEDECDEENEEDDDDEKDEEDEEDLDENLEDDKEIIEDFDDESHITKVKVSSKKKSKTVLNSLQNTLRGKQQLLLIKQGFEEMQSERPIPKEAGKEKTIRDHVLQKINNLIPSLKNKKDQENLEMSILISAMRDANTKSVLKHFDNELFMVCYTSAFRRFMSNLSRESYVKNTHLLNKIENKDLTIENLSEMTIQEFAPALYANLRERQSLREQQQLEGNKSMATDMFKCGRCHKRETTFYELQTRSADEPMTKFITCLNCGNHWRK